MTGGVLTEEEHVAHGFKGVECMRVEQSGGVCEISTCLLWSDVISTSLLGAESREEFEREQKPLVMLLLVLRCSLSAVDGGRGDIELSNTESFSPSSPSAVSRGRGLLDVEGVLHVTSCSLVLGIYELAVGVNASSWPEVGSCGVVMSLEELPFCTLNSSIHSRPDIKSALAL